MNARMYACIALLAMACVANAAAANARTGAPCVLGCDKCAAASNNATTCTLCSSPAYALKNGKCGACFLLVVLWSGAVDDDDDLMWA